MDSARPLRDVFADLTGAGNAAGDPEALLRDQGHPELPEHLVAEAVVSYAETAPAEVAEHLAPYVTAHSAVGAGEAPGDEPAVGWLDLLGTAPVGAGPDAELAAGPAADAPADLDSLAPAPDGLEAAAGIGTEGIDAGGIGTEGIEVNGIGTEGIDDVDDFGPDPALGLDFGLGTEAVPETGTGDLADAGPEGAGPESTGPESTGPEGVAPEGVEEPGEGGDVQILSDPSDGEDAAGAAEDWATIEHVADPATVDEPGPEAEPLA